MNVVPRGTGPRVAGKNHADKTFFHRDRATDFELRFVPAACDSSMVVLVSTLPLCRTRCCSDRRSGNAGEL
jgi:hypothetical protein